MMVEYDGFGADYVEISSFFKTSRLQWQKNSGSQHSEPRTPSDNAWNVWADVNLW